MSGRSRSAVCTCRRLNRHQRGRSREVRPATGQSVLQVLGLVERRNHDADPRRLRHRRLGRTSARCTSGVPDGRGYALSAVEGAAALGWPISTEGGSLSKRSVWSSWSHPIIAGISLDTARSTARSAQALPTRPLARGDEPAWREIIGISRGHPKLAPATRDTARLPRAMTLPRFEEESGVLWRSVAGATVASTVYACLPPEHSRRPTPSGGTGHGIGTPDLRKSTVALPFRRCHIRLRQRADAAVILHVCAAV